MSCLSMANLQIKVGEGVGLPAFSGNPFQKFV